MKKILLGAAVAMLGIAPALAADMAPRYTKAPPPVAAAVYNWTGFYIGANAGGTWDNNHSVDTLGLPVGPVGGIGPGSFAANSAAAATGSISFGNNGRFIGGGQIGYNWQFGGRGVAGFEADIDGLAQSKHPQQHCWTFPVRWRSGGHKLPDYQH